MHTFIFTKNAEKAFRVLSQEVQERILKKLKHLKTHPDLFSLLKSLHNFAPATHRLRVGSHRIILELKEQKKADLEFWILDVDDRKKVYM